MGLLDKAKAAAEQAATKAKEGVEEVQTKRELSQAYGELGKTAFELVESGDVSHPRLQTLADKVRALEERAAGTEPSGEASNGHDPSQPPAMPT
ncbi:MAG TPA: hypothetical protein VMU58_00935 [Gaiellaceae bacterium]|nr:hypothetical protein [Gaiellaceae bacterium]